jgi:hypothetical protein
VADFKIWFSNPPIPTIKIYSHLYLKIDHVWGSVLDTTLCDKVSQ